MQRDKLYDALDHAKTGMLKGLPAKLPLHVVPMWTQVKRSSVGEVQLYRSLFRDGSVRLLKRRERFLHGNRETYFRTVAQVVQNYNDAVIFLDADTGLAPTSGATNRHVAASEVKAIVGASGSRVVVIYQHSDRGSKSKTTARLTEILKRLCKRNSPLHGFAFWGAIASLLFLAKDRTRLAAVRSSYAVWAGAQAKRRITRIHP